MKLASKVGKKSIIFKNDECQKKFNHANYIFSRLFTVSLNMLGSRNEVKVWVLSKS